MDRLKCLSSEHNRDDLTLQFAKIAKWTEVALIAINYHETYLKHAMQKYLPSTMYVCARTEHYYQQMMHLMLVK